MATAGKVINLRWRRVKFRLLRLLTHARDFILKMFNGNKNKNNIKRNERRKKTKNKY